MLVRTAKFGIGQVVHHRKHPFRGIIFDVDPIFENSEKWLNSMPEENKPLRDQPYYHLLAENSETSYIAYVSEQNLLVDESSQPVSHPLVGNFFLNDIENGHYTARHTLTKNLT
jgi:heat shock protein HspQ